MSSEKVLVTGGAGFIGSHLVNRLVEKGKEVIIFDNLTSGKKEFINEKAQFIEGDLLNKQELEEACKNTNEVWHLAANYNVRIPDRNIHFEQNATTTLNLLEAMQKCNIKKIHFTSSGVVYGNAKQMPTPENYEPLEPISAYGESKLAAENSIKLYCDNNNFNAQIFRLANIIGKRSDHGIIPDFIKKLKENPAQLEIFGDGKQQKSYLHVSDCVDAMLFTAEKQKDKIEIYNVGAEDNILIDKIADIVIEKTHSSAKKTYTGGNQGWKGDVPVFLLSIDKLKSIGWNPKLNSQEAVEKTVNELINA